MTDKKPRGRPFQKGADSRRKPGGLPPGYHAFRAACQERSVEALSVLVTSLTDEDARIRIEAAKVIIERAWGKPAAAEEDREAVERAGEAPRELVLAALERLARG